MKEQDYYEDRNKVYQLMMQWNKMTEDEQLNNQEIVIELFETLDKWKTNNNDKKLSASIEKIVSDVWNKIKSFNLKQNIINKMKLGNFSNVVWKNLTYEVQKELFLKGKDRFERYKYLWKNTKSDLQYELIKKKTYGISNFMWKDTNIEAQKKFIEYCFDNYRGMQYLKTVWPYTNEELRDTYIEQLLERDIHFWKKTDLKIQKKLLLVVIVKIRNAKDISDDEKKRQMLSIWNSADEEVQFDKFKEVLKLDIDNSEEIKKVMFDSIKKEKIIDIWEQFTDEEKTQNFKYMINTLATTNDIERRKKLPEFLKKIDENLDTKKLIDILTMRDNEFLTERIISKEFIKYFSTDNMDINEINKQIGDIHNIFLTNNLPETIKLFEFFKYHPNYNKSNNHLYKNTSQEERDKKILNDLFVTSLDSDNRQLGNFLELIHAGDLLYNKKRNGYKLEEYEEAILYSYSEALTSLYSVSNKEKIYKTTDISLNIENIREKLNIDKNADVGDSLLLQYLEGIGFNVEDYEQQGTVCEILLKYMKQQREKALERNKNDFNINELLKERRLNKRDINRYVRFSLKTWNKVKGI